MKSTRPAAGVVCINDSFWTPYLENIRQNTIPHVFEKFREIGYLHNYEILSGKTDGNHMGPHFANGLLLESIRGVCDFLAADYDPTLEARIDPIIDDIVISTDRTDGIPLSYNHIKNIRPWGVEENIIYTHDLYNIGTLIEAGVQHYLATKKTKLLTAAIKAANRICFDIGAAPKINVVPGHSLPEEAMMRLYRLLRDHRELDDLAASLDCNLDEYLRVVRYWYDHRGDRTERYPVHADRFAPSYNQDHLPFAEQTEAVGHAVRATLCYTGAAALTYDTDDRYLPALDAIWENIITKKMHVSGGIGTRHDIEGFDVEYNLPANAYLETCASVGLMFFAGEMALLRRNSAYYDTFERALYNTILASVGEDGRHYFYQNPLTSDGSIRRWDWHSCPCCPPMLLKLFSSLSTYIYTYDAASVDVNLLIGSRLTTDVFSVEQADHIIRMDSKNKEMTVRIRIPAYAEHYCLKLNGNEIPYTAENGYAAITRVWNGDDCLSVCFEEPPRRICCHPKAEDNRGKVCIMRGPYLMCAEGFDNANDVGFTIAEHPALRCERDGVVGLRADGGMFHLIPYYKWCRRESDDPSARCMNVWFTQENMVSCEIIENAMRGELYYEYETLS